MAFIAAIAVGVGLVASASASGLAAGGIKVKQNIAKRKLSESIHNECMLNDLPEIDFKDLELDKDPLGAGNFGVVYKGIYTKTKSEKFEVAVKTIKDITSHTQHLDEKQSTDLLLECKQMMKLCDHPMVVSIYGYSVNVYLPSKSPFDSKTEPKYDVYLVMERCEESLWEFIKRRGGGLDHKHLLEIAAQIAQGMTYVAEQGITHRDLRSGNILVNEKGKVIKIGDFGLSRNMEQALNSAAYYRGNSNSQFPSFWAAPESVREVSPIWSEKSDVWSYGVVMIELFTAGKSPSHAMPPVRGRKNMKPFDQPLACPDNIYEDLIVKCWEDDPKKRPTFKQISAIVAKLHAQFAMPVEDEEKPVPESP